MTPWKIAGAAALLACTPQPGLASGTDYVAQPLQVGRESARFDQGVATVELEQGHGAIQITPLPMDHGNLAFAVAVFNAGPVAANIDARNIAVLSGGQRLTILDTQQLVSKVKSRAIWKQIGLAAIGGLAAGVASSQRDYYHGSFRNAYGQRSHFAFSAPSLGGQLQAAAITTDTQYGMFRIRDQLDRTRAAIGEETLQLSTIAPGESYAGKIVLARFKPSSYPQRIDLAVDWNGETYSFAFQLARFGTPQPAFTNIAVPDRPRMAPAVVAPAPIVERPIVMASAAAVPVRTVAYVAPPRTSYEKQIAAAQGVHGREPKQGWTISD